MGERVRDLLATLECHGAVAETGRDLQERARRQRRRREGRQEGQGAERAAEAGGGGGQNGYALHPAQYVTRNALRGVALLFYKWSTYKGL